MYFLGIPSSFAGDVESLVFTLLYLLDEDNFVPWLKGQQCHRSAEVYRAKQNCIDEVMQGRNRFASTPCFEKIRQYYRSIVKKEKEKEKEENNRRRTTKRHKCTTRQLAKENNKPSRTYAAIQEEKEQENQGRNGLATALCDVTNSYKQLDERTI